MPGRLVLVTIWLSGALVIGSIATFRWLGCHRLLAKSAVVKDEAIQQMAAQLAHRLGLRRRVRVVVTSSPVGPVTFGIVRPTVLLPETVLRGRSPGQIEPILAHELVHVRRGDPTMGVLQVLAQLIWWFHPLVWWANRNACWERERCCDEEVIAGLGCKPALYARCLLDVLESAREWNPLFAIPGVRPAEITSARLEGIMKRVNRFQRRTPRWCWAVTLAAAVLILPGRGLVIGGPAEQPKSDPKEVESPDAKESATADIESPKTVIVDADTGLEFHRFASLANEPTVPYHTALSPNGKFLLTHNYVVPLDGTAAIRLGDYPAYWGRWSPDGKKIAFHSFVPMTTWLVTVSAESGKPIGPPEKILEHRPRVASLVTWSPDGEAFAYHSREGIWIHSLRDSTEVQITDEYVDWVSWSPDGKWLAVRKDDKFIWLMSPDGGTTRKLVDGVPRARVYWTPDNQWVFYQQKQQLRFIRLSDSLKVGIKLPKDVGGYLSWTPDGKEMLFYKGAYEWTVSLKLVPALGGELRDPLKEHRYSGIQQFWSPDGTYVATHDWNRFWIVPVSGAEPYPLELNVQIEAKRPLTSESISPDGRRLLFEAGTQVGQEYYDKHYVVPISLEQGKSTGEPVQVFDKKIAWKGWNPGVEWSPDGTRLALFSDDDLWIASSDGSDPIRLTNDPDPEGGVEWSADGKELTWTSYSRSTRTSTQYTCEAPGGKPVKLIDDVDVLGAVEYTRTDDGKAAIYTLRDGEKTQLWVENRPRDERKKLLEIEQNRRREWTYALSPDGKWLAAFFDGRISLFSLPDGQHRTIANGPDVSSGVSQPRLEWSPDSDGLALQLFQKYGDELSSHLFAVSIHNDKWAELGPNDTGAKYSLDWSPDGEWISYSSDGERKVRQEAVIWSVDISSFLEDAAEKATARTSPAEG